MTVPHRPSRRGFIASAVALGAGSLLLGSTASAEETDDATRRPKRRNDSAKKIAARLREMPDRVMIDHEGVDLLKAERSGSEFSTAQALVKIDASPGELKVRVNCATAPLARVVLRWQVSFPADTLFLGDHWERGYGDLQWRFAQSERILPWYFAAHQEATGSTIMAGVKTQPSTFCFWTIDGDGISLWLDFRNGGSPSLPGNREISAATIVSLHAEIEESPTAALTRFCRLLCPAPRLSKTPVAGNNNWYYAYGHDFDADAIRRDAAFLAEISAGHANRPYCVIDAGWTPDLGSVCPGGPWTVGDPKRFPDPAKLAADIKKLGVRPGIWIRPTALMNPPDNRRLRAGPVTAFEKPLDLTLPENSSLIHDDVARIRSWGFDLIKHDFSTYDFFGKWGFEMGPELTDARWHFSDRTLTNAEIILRHYQNLRDAAGDALLLGCNTVGHIGAGLFEIQRTGDDTSGKEWERTRRMGINNLAYRLPQNGTFFTSDADCAAHTENTPWELDSQYLDLIARSGTALFVSVNPKTVDAQQKATYKSAMRLALSGGTPGGCEPLDWLHTTAPREWRLGTEKVRYDWEGPNGVSPFRI